MSTAAAESEAAARAAGGGSSHFVSSPQEPTIRIKTERGKPFSVERYYMLSEIEQQAIAPVYLREHSYPEEQPSEASNDGISSSSSNNNNNNPDESTTTDSHTTEETAATSDDEEALGCELPPFCLLYLLWDCGSKDLRDKSPEEVAAAFCQGPLHRALFQLTSLTQRVRSPSSGDHPTVPKVHLVVDVLAPPASEASSSTSREEAFRRHLEIASALAPALLRHARAKSVSLRAFGATVGLADHNRAAPALESCLEAIAWGARDRRRWCQRHQPDANETGVALKSCVGIVCQSLQDLVGYDEETETDAVQGVLQAKTHAWFEDSATTKDGLFGNTIPDGTEAATAAAASFRPPILDFATQAHKHWRVNLAGLPPEPSREELLEDERAGRNNETERLVLWIVAIVAVLFAAWRQTE